MRKKSFLAIVILLFTVLIFTLTACNKEEPISENPVQVADGATTRGGFLVTGPQNGGQHGWAFGSYAGDIGEFGYIEEEYFIEGTAQHYEPIGKLSDDGKWTLQAVSTAPYKTRFIVRRPTDPTKFNGTVVLEWANVSGGYEMSFMDSPGLYKEGFAYVAVSTQMNGLYGFEENPQGLIVWDSERYGDLSIPDDGLSYDIFTQVARAVGNDRPKNGIDPMGGLVVEKMFAVGESQSGSRVLSYANGIQPIEKVFDAIIPVVSSGRGTDFAQEMAHVKENGKTKVRNVSTRVREDINCKVFIINTQTESIALGKLAQPDTKNIVSWQVAGASHFAPKSMETIYKQNQRDGIGSLFRGDNGLKLKAVDWTNVYETALVRIQEWIDEDRQPSEIEPLDTINILLGYHKDKYGNANGGVRLPEVVVPIATYNINIMKGLSGTVYAFSQDELMKLYPTHQDYVDKVTQAANTAVEQGVILPYRAEEYIEEAKMDWVATLWTDFPAIIMGGGDNLVDLGLIIFIGICMFFLIIILVVFLIFLRRKAVWMTEKQLIDTFGETDIKLRSKKITDKKGDKVILYDAKPLKRRLRKQNKKVKTLKWEP